MNRFTILGAAFQYPVPGPWSYNPVREGEDVSETYSWSSWGPQPQQGGKYGYQYAAYPFPSSGPAPGGMSFPAGYSGPQPIFVPNDDGTMTQVMGAEKRDAAPLKFVITDKPSQFTATPIVDAPPIPPPPDLPPETRVTDRLVPPNEGEGFLTRRQVWGLPNWQVGLIGVGSAGALGLFVDLLARVLGSRRG